MMHVFTLMILFMLTISNASAETAQKNLPVESTQNPNTAQQKKPALKAPSTAVWPPNINPSEKITADSMVAFPTDI